MIKPTLKRLVGKALIARGYQISKFEPRVSKWNADTIRGYGPAIRTCFDVGAAYGTPVLYDAFPDAFHVLLEPLEEYDSKIKSILENLSGVHYRTAVGSETGNTTVHVGNDKMILRSSCCKRTVLEPMERTIEDRIVSITTLDALLDSESFAPPFGLKIDTEGFELHVIRGAEKLLRDTDFVIAEVSYGDRFENGYSFADFTDEMMRQGFYLHDILKVVGWSQIKFFDAVFKKSAAR